MTFAEVLNKSTIVKNIPLIFEGRKLPKGMNSTVILIRVQYEKYVEEFNSLMEKVQKELKKDGFDERTTEIESMKKVFERKKLFEEGKNTENDVEPTEEELKKAEETKLKEEDYNTELAELNAEYQKAYLEKLKEEVNFKERKFSKEELDEIIDLIGTEGDIKINDNSVPKEHFINTIAFLFANLDD